MSLNPTLYPLSTPPLTTLPIRPPLAKKKEKNKKNENEPLLITKVGAQILVHHQQSAASLSSTEFPEFDLLADKTRAQAGASRHLGDAPRNPLERDACCFWHNGLLQTSAGISSIISGILWSIVPVQNIQRSTTRQASRLRSAPEQLRKYIDIANLLPPRESPPELLPAGAPVAEVTVAQWSNVVTAIGDLIKRFPRFGQFMKGVDLRQYPPVEAYRRCRDFAVVRDVMFALARSDKTKLAESIPIATSLEGLVSISANQNGILRLERMPLLQAIEGIEASRVRQCPICRNIFWAGRIDQPCCSTPCAKICRTRRWREGYIEKYKVQRCGKAETEDKGKRRGRTVSEKHERERLASRKAPDFARRPPRLPKSGR
jgi:hypothetical protein